jgi:hypothetical protein
VTIAPLPPPPPPPTNLEEFLARYAPPSFRSFGVGRPAAARFAAELVRAAARGEEMSLEDAALPGGDLYAVDDVLSELVARAREFPSATSLLFQVLRDYRSRIEVIPAPPAKPGQLLRQPPTARVKPRPGPVFAPSRKQMTLAPAVVARQLHEVAVSGEAAARFLRTLAAAVGDTSMPGQERGADTTSLDDAGREAVAALLGAAARAMRAGGKGDLAAGLAQVLGEWEVWARATQPRTTTGSA